MIKKKYPYFINYAKWAERVINNLVQSGERKFIIYPFGERGKLVKSILNVYHDIQECMIVDNLLSEKYSVIKNINELNEVDLEDALVLITSDRESYLSEIDEIMNVTRDSFYDSLRKELYKVVPKEKCVELFPRPPFIYEFMPTDNDYMSLTHQMQMIATEETAKYIIDNFSGKVRRFAHRYQMYENVLSEYVENDLGMFVEFGVCSGMSINFFAAFNPTRLVYGFDSFVGNPDDWYPGTYGNRFDMKGVLPKVNNNVRLVTGWFDESIPDFLRKHKENIAFMHIDCDIYSSVKTVFSLLKNRIVPGTVIIFDEYFNYPGWKEHEYKAFQEFVLEQSVKYEYIGYTNGQVAIKIIDIQV